MHLIGWNYFGFGNHVKAMRIRKLLVLGYFLNHTRLLTVSFFETSNLWQGLMIEYFQFSRKRFWNENHKSWLAEKWKRNSKEFFCFWILLLSTCSYFSLSFRYVLKKICWRFKIDISITIYTLEATHGNSKVKICRWIKH